jgi:hypothetical protein
MRRLPPHTILTLRAPVRGRISREPLQSMVICLASDGRGEEALPVKAERWAAGVPARDRSGAEGMRLECPGQPGHHPIERAVPCRSEFACAAPAKWGGSSDSGGWPRGRACEVRRRRAAEAASGV